MRKIKVNGRTYDSWRELQKNGEEELALFLRAWWDEKPYVWGHTSGSTGKPKKIRLDKTDMRSSARITNAFFGINSSSILLLCLSISYIAGKMMVVRALEAGAELWTGKVSSHPLKEGNIGPWEDGKTIDLAAMVPMQVEETLQIPEEKTRLSEIRRLLIGGAAVSDILEKRLETLSTHCYATYGMTETVSHVALRKLNRDVLFFALGEVSFSTDERGCLMIQAPHLKTGNFVTNDLVRLSDAFHFEWLGRYDHIINSGGIKFSPEVLERKLVSCIPERYYITSRPDERLGQRIVLVIEKEISGLEEQKLLWEKLRQLFSPYEMPKEILFYPHFQETYSGKVLRQLPDLA